MTLVMHHHIYKNAGSTVDWILQRNFPGKVLHIEGDHPGARLRTSEIAEAAAPFPDHAAIASHTAPLPSTENAWALCHLTILRHPVERLYSMYNFDRRRKDDHSASVAARESDFRGYCEWWLSRKNSVMRNWQVRCCTPQSWLETKDTAGIAFGWDADLKAACQTIREGAFVGVVEEFDKSMVVLESMLQKKGVTFDAAYVSQNVSNDETALRSEDFFVDKMGVSNYRNFTADNTMDFQLLEYAKNLLAEKFNQLPDGKKALSNFHSRCVALAENSLQASVSVPPRSEWLFVGGRADEEEKSKIVMPTDAKTQRT